MEMELEESNASVDIIDIPCRGSGGGGRGPRDQTVVSVVNRGWHYNIFPSGAQCEVIRGWLHGANIRVQRKDGRPEFLRLRAAEHWGHTLRSQPSQRDHFAVPTAAVGKVDGSIKGRVVESWIEGDEICIRIASFYEGGQP